MAQRDYNIHNNREHGAELEGLAAQMNEPKWCCFALIRSRVGSFEKVT